jgi:hypothetical protein
VDLGRAGFRDGLYRFPRLRVAGPLYARKLGADLSRGNWSGVGRLVLVPPLAFTAGLKSIARLGARRFGRARKPA